MGELSNGASFIGLASATRPEGPYPSQYHLWLEGVRQLGSYARVGVVGAFER